MKKQMIFVVEDDPALQELYQYSLENAFACRCFSDGESFFAALQACRPDLVLLDIMLPGDDGFSILARLKAGSLTSRVPVIMVSAKGEEIAKVKGLNMGADDYIAKPFGLLELEARIRANLRKGARETETADFKDIVIDSDRHSITANGHSLRMTLKEYNLLCFLCRNAEKVQSREVIFTEVWGDGFVGETRTLDIHIKELRKKLAAAESLAGIKTIRGVGYMLT